MTPEIEQLIHDVLHGDASDAGRQRLSGWVTADEANARAYLRVVMDERAIRSNLERDAARSVEALSDSPDDSRAGIVLAELTKLEAEAKAPIITLDPPADLVGDTASPTKHDYAEAGRYLFEHAIADKRLVYTAVSALAAAVILLAAIVWLPFGSSDPPTPSDPSQLAVTPTPKQLPIVATLTNSVDAQWRTGDKPVAVLMGTQFVAWERYTLTHGFAEITTRRGATALLQAPCTIELTDSPNAIRLYQGKLVGKCETPSSKGFIVHASGMDVIDLGTEFGVAVDAAGVSTVRVMSGLVRAQPGKQSALAFAPVVLTKGQARRLVPETGGLEMIALSDAPVFSREIKKTHAAAVLDSEPVAYWRFEGAQAGAVVNEAAPGRHDLRVVGSATIDRQGVFGSAGRIDSNSDSLGSFQVDGPLNGGFFFEQSFSIEAWCWIRAGGHKEAMRIVSTKQGSSGIGLGVLGEKSFNAENPDEIRKENQPFFTLFGVADFIGMKSIPEERWTHLVVVVDWHKRVRMYIDGREVQVRKFTMNQPDGDATLNGIDPYSLAAGRQDVLIGRNPKGSDPLEPWFGKLDEIAIHDRVLTATEIRRRPYK
ncbi:MAG: LamG domain-containing protein [Phycisphaeraceae bacterium]|nr:LamG domain-containing protein [Phycisphaeraceae bacterium]